MLTKQVSLPAIGQAGESLLPQFVWCVRDFDMGLAMGDVELVLEDFLDSIFHDAKGILAIPNIHNNWVYLLPLWWQVSPLYFAQYHSQSGCFFAYYKCYFKEPNQNKASRHKTFW